MTTLQQPRPGPHRAVRTSLSRTTGSVRRTTSIDVTRPDGLLGRVTVLAAGQDLATETAGASTVVTRWSATIDVDPTTGEITGITVDPSIAVDPSATRGRGNADDEGRDKSLDALVGSSVRSGLARRVAELLADDVDTRSLRYSLLEDLAGAFLVSGFAPLRAGLLAGDPEDSKRLAPLQADICAGWAVGEAIHTTLAEHGHTAVPQGPDAPALEHADPDGWHPLPPLGAETVRRRRLLDITPLDDERVAARSHFRDSWAGEGEEMVMHEYAVDATVAHDRVADIAVDPRVLPWEACPGAVASAQRVVGVSVDDLATTARTQLVGPTTCTHLTSTIRALADLRALVPLARLVAQEGTS